MKLGTQETDVSSHRDAIHDHLLAGIAVAILVLLTCYGEHSILNSIDYQLIIKPQLQFAMESISAGEIPWWNPYSGLGRPLMTDIHYGLWYPPTYLLLLGENTGVFLLVWLHYLLLWSGTRQLIRHFGGTRMMAFVGGIVMCLTGNFNGRLLSGMFYFVFQECYAPWILLLTLQLGKSWNGRTVSMLALTSGAAFLCGNGHVFWIIHCGAGITLFVRSLLALRQEPVRDALQPLQQWAVAMVFVAGLCAIAWQPYLDLVEHGNRQNSTYEFTAFGSADLRALYSLLYGNSADLNVDWEKNFFVGSFWCFAGAIGLFRLRHPDVRPLGIVAAFCILFALGHNTPFHGLFVHVLPGADLFRVPPRIMLWPTIILVVLAAAWLSRAAAKESLKFPLMAVVALPFIWHFAWFCDLSSRMPPFSAGALLAFVVSAVATLTWPQLWTAHHRPWRYAILIGIVALEFIPFTAHIQKKYLPLDTRFHASTAGEALIKDVSRLNDGKGHAQPAPRINLPRSLASANAGLVSRVAGVNADTPLFLDRPWRYLNLIAGENPECMMNNTLPARITELRSDHLPYISLDYEYDPLTGRALEVWAPFPRAYFSTVSLTATNSDDAMAAIVAGVPVGKVTIVENSDVSRQAAPPQAESNLSFVAYGNNRVTVALTNSHPGYLVLNEAWFPGWKASRDGVVYETEPANVWMRGVLLPAGAGPVEFFFEPQRLTSGMAITGGMILLIIAVLIRDSSRLQPGPGGTVTTGEGPGSGGAGQAGWINLRRSTINQKRLPSDSRPKFVVEEPIGRTSRRHPGLSRGSRDYSGKKVFATLPSRTISAKRCW